MESEFALNAEDFFNTIGELVPVSKKKWNTCYCITLQSVVASRIVPNASLQNFDGTDSCISVRIFFFYHLYKISTDGLGEFINRNNCWISTALL